VTFTGPFWTVAAVTTFSSVADAPATYAGRPPTSTTFSCRRAEKLDPWIVTSVVGGPAVGSKCVMRGPTTNGRWRSSQSRSLSGEVARARMVRAASVLVIAAALRTRFDGLPFAGDAFRLATSRSFLHGS